MKNKIITVIIIILIIIVGLIIFNNKQTKEEYHKEINYCYDLPKENKCVSSIDTIKKVCILECKRG